MSSRRATALLVSLYAAVMAWAWLPFLDGQRSPFERDVEFYHYPVSLELFGAWSAGRIPLWTDRIYCGFPFFADPQTAAWYPGTLLVAALGPHWGYVLFLLLHAGLAALGTCWLVRAHGGGVAAGFAAGLVVPLSGYFVFETQHPGLFAILCWIPWWLLASRAVFARPTASRLALAALPLAMMAFAGTLQVLFGAVVLFAFYVAGLALEARGRRDSRAAIRGACAVALAQVLGLLLAAVVLLPALAHFPLTARALGMTYRLASLGSVEPLRLLGMFAKGAESLLPATAQLDFQGTSFYVGVLTLPLAGVALTSSPRRLPALLALAAVAIGVLAAGRYGGLHPLLYAWWPGAVGALRGMVRALGAEVVCLALLAGLGLDRLREPRARRVFAALLGVALAVQGLVLWATRGAGGAAGGIAVLAAALALCGLLSRRPGWLQPALATLVAIDLLALGSTGRVLDAKPPPPGPRQLAGAVRFPALSDIAGGRFGEPDGRVLLLGFGSAGNLTFHHQLDGVGGYNPLVTLQYLDYVSLANRGRLEPREPLDRFVHSVVPGRIHSGLFDAASIRFVISAVPLAGDGLRRLARYGVHPLTHRPVLLYENERALPRAYLAYRTRRATSTQDLERWLGADFDGHQTTVFEGDAPALSGPAEIETVPVTRVRPERLSFAVSPERPALLVLTDSWYPGWEARVDGVPAPVLRVNANFRGVPLPAGARHVELRFEPWSFRAGALLSLSAGLGWALLLAGPSVFRRMRGI